MCEVVCRWTFQTKHSHRRRRQPWSNNSWDLSVVSLPVTRNNEKRSFNLLWNIHTTLLPSIEQSQSVEWVGCHLRPERFSLQPNRNLRFSLANRHPHPPFPHTYPETRCSISDLDGGCRGHASICSKDTINRWTRLLLAHSTYDIPWQSCLAISISWLIFQCRSRMWMCL